MDSRLSRSKDEPSVLAALVPGAEIRDPSHRILVNTATSTEVSPGQHVCCFTFSFSFSSRWHRSAQKGPYALRHAFQQSPQDCPRNSANVCLVEHRSLPTCEDGMSAANFLSSSVHHAIDAVMLWPVHVQKFPQSSEHLRPTKLQTRCDICCLWLTDQLSVRHAYY